MSSLPPDPQPEDAVLAFQDLSPDQMLDAVESCGIQCDGRFLALNSYENRVYQIGVEDDEPVVVKFYRPDRWSDDAILEEHEFTRELDDYELPVIAPLSIAGDTLHHLEHYRFALYPCRGGRAPELDNAGHLEMLGRFIARIHNIGGIGAYRHRPQISIASYITEPSEYLLDKHYIPNYLRDNWHAAVQAVTDAALATFDRAGTVRTLRLHGDLHHGNVLWTGQGPHIVDFDDARSGPAIQDLWMFLSGDRSYRQARLANLIDGYEQFRDFDHAELCLIEALRGMRMVHHAGWLAKRWQDPAFPVAFPWFNTEKYWEQQITDLFEQVQVINEDVLVV